MGFDTIEMNLVIVVVVVALLVVTDHIIFTVLQIPVHASQHGPLADFFKQAGPV